MFRTFSRAERPFTNRPQAGILEIYVCALGRSLSEVVVTRSVFFALCVLALSVVSIGCDPPGSVRPRRDGGGTDDDGGGGPLLPDQDGDGIPDQYEGRTTNDDTDGDGTPDYMDADSDGDGLTDMLEGGNPNGPPLDTDGDGTPDFRDLDSDGNGIPDSVEGEGDPDGDGAPNSRDNDNDGDTVTDTDEIGGTPSSPADTDGDLVPDYLDGDSDNDLIGDRDEGVADTDRDGTVDRFDADSDDDGISDTDEAGDGDATTPPRDTDGDMIPDFRDTDSDGDGLSDTAEHEFDLAHPGASTVTDADSDDDGVSDLVEVASGTDPLDASDSPRTRGDFVFLEPYMMAPDPMRDTLDFATNIRSADVYFLIDTTGSMSAAIANVRTSLSTPSTGIIDQVRASIADTEFGVGDFKDAGDPYIFQHRTDITTDAAAAQAGVSALSASGGGDTPEGDTPSLWSLVTGGALTGTAARTGCPAGTFGYACFREGAVPIIVVVTDAPFHNGPGGTNPSSYTDYNTMRDAVVGVHARVMGVAIGSAPVTDLNAIATDSGAVDGSGAPLVTLAASGAVSTTVVDQIRVLASQSRFDISITFEDDPSDTVDTFPAFVDHVEANTAGDVTRGCGAHAAIDTNSDGVLDTFPDVTAGERVCFDIVVKQNDTVMPTGVPQLFLATLHVIGDGFTELDSREVYFLVPPTIEPPGGPD
jgi:hypothetical protein